MSVPLMIFTEKPQAKSISQKLCPVLLCHSALMICSELWACVGVCMYVTPCTFDWRHTTAGSDYKDMEQIAVDYCFMQR